MTMQAFDPTEPNATNSAEANARDNLFGLADNSHTDYEDSEGLVSTKEEWATLFGSERTSVSTIVLADIIRATQQFVATRNTLSDFGRTLRSAIYMASEVVVRWQELAAVKNLDSDDIGVLDETEHFLKAHQLGYAFTKMLDLIDTHFIDSEVVSTNIRFDEETDEQWVEVIVRVNSSPQETAETDTRILLDWVSEVSVDQLDLIRIGYTLK